MLVVEDGIEPSTHGVTNSTMNDAYTRSVKDVCGVSLRTDATCLGFISQTISCLLACLAF